MTGETNLAVLMRSLRPRVRPEPYVFCSMAAADAVLIGAAFAMVREDEGITLILPVEVAYQHGLVQTPRWACITLRVHSSLEAVGMIAAISTCFTTAGISTNPVAGYYHDHLFVQWNRQQEALELLEILKQSYR
jgi:uncharacterized protein